MALENELALKKTQPRQTNWNVQNRCHHDPRPPVGHGRQPPGDPTLAPQVADHLRRRRAGRPR